MSITIKNGAYDLHSSGSLVIDSESETVMVVAQEDESLRFVFKFESGPLEPMSPRLKVTGIDETTMEITFVNFVSPISTYSREYWQVGNLKDRRLFFVYNIQSFPETRFRSFGYSFYLGEAVANAKI